MPDSDEELLLAVARGPGALPEFYRRHVGRVIAMGVRRFGNAEDVADFTAEVFYEVMTSAGGFDPRRGKAVSWLYGLAGNVATRMYREMARERAASTRLAGRALLDEADHLRVEQRIDAEREVRRVYEALQRLDDRDRRLLELVAVDRLSPAEAANALGISRVAARVRLNRARQRLREAMAAMTAPGLSHLVRVPTGEEIA